MISIPRRRLIGAAAALPLAPVLAWADCGKPTAEQTEGPFFKPASPLRTSLLEKGARPGLLLSGVVMSAQCRPLANALLDFWHADEDGEYDNAGFRYRGHQHADAQGRYRLETIFPAVYPGRTRHLHVKIQAPGGPVLTTQVYFPSEPANRRDGLFSPALAMRMAKPGEGSFDFVV